MTVDKGLLNTDNAAVSVVLYTRGFLNDLCNVIANVYHTKNPRGLLGFLNC